MKIDAKYHFKTGTHCWYCDRIYGKDRNIYIKTNNPLLRTIDHIYPRSKRGLDSADNKIGCCEDCNNLKANRTPLEFVELLKGIQKDVNKWGHPMSKYIPLMIFRAYKIHNKANKQKSIKTKYT